MHEADGSKGIPITKRNVGRRNVNIFERIQRQLLEDYLDAIGLDDYNSGFEYDVDDDEYYLDDEFHANGYSDED